MSAAYDPDNIFAKILRGELPAHTVYEDAHTLAFMDVMPQGEGHTLVIPKAPSRGLLDAEPETLAALARSVQTVARAVKAAFEADGLTVFQFNEPASGQTVFHLHFHIIPRRDGVPLKRHEGGMADGAVLAEHAARIRAALG
ncbi:HIT family protein [Methylobacterium sp. NEAU 140]|uniref:HIT family protein n=1 Tax=Methylobacterium sp. NEAU 140 TaxID=3064945 RepID=UPI0027337665|nr:HIT family protein [Methylobacterium sp. NEAU 140]MDP4025341.1 HIT family protein [Methylobacterium sp. NEAU 140]